MEESLTRLLNVFGRLARPLMVTEKNELYNAIRQHIEVLEQQQAVSSLTASRLLEIAREKLL